MSTPKFLSLFNLNEQEKEKLLAESQSKNLIHQITKKYENSIKVDYISLVIENLSLQSLVWILKSLRIDKITPSEKLILSRIKECFAYKIPLKNWEKLVIPLKKQKFYNNYEEFVGKI